MYVLLTGVQVILLELGSIPFPTSCSACKALCHQFGDGKHLPYSFGTQNICFIAWFCNKLQQLLLDYGNKTTNILLVLLVFLLRPFFSILNVQERKIDELKC